MGCKKWLSLALIAASLVSCSKNPFTNPYAYAPLHSNQTWEPTKYEIKKLDTVKSLDSLEIPSASDCISLGDLFDIGLANSPETRRSWEEAREKAAGYSAAMSEYLPSINMDANYWNIRQGSVFNDDLFLTIASQWGPEANLSYLLWDSGERRYKTEFAFQILQQANWAHNEEIQRVLQSIAASYYQYLYSKALFEADQADLLNAEETYRAAKEKCALGIFDETDMLQAKTHYLQKKVDLTGQTAVVNNAFVDLLSVLGIPANISFQLGSFPNQEPIEQKFENIDELIAIAKAKRPDLIAAKAEILAFEAQVEKKKSELYPKVNLSFQGGQQWFNNGTTDAGNYYLSIDLTFPVFTGFYYLNQIKQAQSQLEKQIATFKETELIVLKQVKQSHNNFLMAKEEISDTKSYLDAAQVEYNAMFERYKIGIINILDLLSSQAYLSDARAKYALAKKNYFMAIINLAFSTGTLANACPLTQGKTNE